eukprot:SAG22_NODE_133_length_18379_cov_34.571937_2_plen_832_part_00
MLTKLNGREYYMDSNDPRKISTRAAGAADSELEKGIHVLDFTAQNNGGMTSRMLMGFGENEEKYCVGDFVTIPLAVNASTPFFKHGKPSIPEQLKHAAAPALYVFGVVSYYADLILDILVTAELYGQKKYAFAYFTGFILFLGFFVHSLMDVLSHWSVKTCSPKGRHKVATGDQEFQDPNGPVSLQSLAKTNHRPIWVQVLMNLLHVRILDETRFAFLDWQDPRMPTHPPASYYQVKLVEGIFEALPQAILQTYVFVDDLASGGTVTLLRMVSLTTSYLSFAGSLATMGIRIRGWWRSTFFGLCLSQALLRAFSITAFALLSNAGPLFWLYLIFSFGATFFFVVVVQARRNNGEMVAFHCSFSTIVVSWIAFFVPIELDSFAVLRSAQPRAAKLPFFAFRFIEMFVFCLVFWVKWEDAQCTGAVNLHSHDTRFTDYAANADPSQHCCKEGCNDDAIGGYCCSWLNLLQSVASPLTNKMNDFIGHQQEEGMCDEVPYQDPTTLPQSDGEEKYGFTVFTDSAGGALRPGADSRLISGHSDANEELPNVWLDLPWSDPPTMEYNGWCTNHLGNVYSARVVLVDEMKANILFILAMTMWTTAFMYLLNASMPYWKDDPHHGGIKRLFKDFDRCIAKAHQDDFDDDDSYAVKAQEEEEDDDDDDNEPMGGSRSGYNSRLPPRSGLVGNGNDNDNGNGNGSGGSQLGWSGHPQAPPQQELNPSNFLGSFGAAQPQQGYGVGGDGRIPPPPTAAPASAPASAPAPAPPVRAPPRPIEAAAGRRSPPSLNLPAPALQPPQRRSVAGASDPAAAAGRGRNPPPALPGSERNLRVLNRHQL